MSCGPHGFRKEDFLRFSHYKSMGANDPRGMANLDLRGFSGRIFVGYHLILLHAKYVSCWPYGFREEVFFLSFLIISLWELITPGAWPVWTPGASLTGFMLGTTRHCYILNI